MLDQPKPIKSEYDIGQLQLGIILLFAHVVFCIQGTCMGKLACIVTSSSSHLYDHVR
jgi:hypothetical protein